MVIVMKRFISSATAFVLTILFLFSVISTVSASELRFSDVPESDYYYEAISFLAENNIIKGVTSTEFAPDSPLTRAMLVTLLGRLENAEPDSKVTAFTDVPENEWYSEYVAWAAENGLVKGYSEKIFAPNDKVTEEQAIVIIDRYCEKFNIFLTLGSYSYSYYDQISDYAVESVNKLSSAGIFTGHRGDNILDPKANATRAFVAELIARVVKLKNDQPKPIDSLDSASVTAALYSFQTEYPEGMSWTNDDYYEWHGGYYTGGYGCAAFTFILSDRIFGTLPVRIITELSDYELRPGDIIRLEGDTHSVIVLEALENEVIIAEGNYNKTIHWGRSLSYDQVMRAEYVLTRYQ